MASEDSVQISQPGDADYPLKTKEGAVNSIDEIRKRCNKDNLFEDPDFPPNDTSIGNVGGDTARGEAGTFTGELAWYRPAYVCDKWKIGKPNFAIGQQADAGAAGRVSALDMRQGGLGDCGWMTAMAAATRNPDLLNIVVPLDNYDGFEDDKYCGAFHFRVFDMKVGKYADVVVDDFLPYNKETANSVFAKPWALGDDGKECGSEFWVPLAEKAFAKYRGAYGHMESWYKRPFSNLELFTGGFDADWIMNVWRGKPEAYAALHEMVKYSLDQGHAMLLSGNKEADSEEGYTKFGLVSGHAYAVIGGAEVHEKDGTPRLLLNARNPWGHKEWTGPLCDGDDEGWAKLDKDLRRRDASGSANMDEGVFWIDLRDVIKYFYAIEFCIFGKDVAGGKCEVRTEWSAELQEKKLPTPGQDWSVMQHMPAFKFELKAGAKPIGPDGKVNPILQFMIGEAGIPLDPLPKFSYYIFKVEPDQDMGDLSNVLKGSSADKGSGYQKEFKSVAGIFLDPGTYVMFPWLQTDDPALIPKAYVGKPLPFTIRMYTNPAAELVKVK